MFSSRAAAVDRMVSVGLFVCPIVLTAYNEIGCLAASAGMQSSRLWVAG